MWGKEVWKDDRDECLNNPGRLLLSDYKKKRKDFLAGAGTGLGNMKG